jgi:hypothetical protein
MHSLPDYIARAKGRAAKTLIQQQWDEACDNSTIHCACGQIRDLKHAYRCLYCGVWFCFRCAEAHFGQTLLEWTQSKRVERRAALRCHAPNS